MTTATQTQIRRDTATNLTAATPVAGELGYDTTNKRLVVGDGSTAGGIKHTSAKDLQNQTFCMGTVGGTADAITITNSPVKAALASGQRGCFKATGTNTTTSVTMNEDILGAKSVKKMSSGALAALAVGDIVTGGIYEYYYDGTQYQIKALGEGPFTTVVTALGVGSIILAEPNATAGTMAAGATTAAANLTPVTLKIISYTNSYDSHNIRYLTCVSSGDTITGTWQALESIVGIAGAVNNANTTYGLFQRIS